MKIFNTCLYIILLSVLCLNNIGSKTLSKLHSENLKGKTSLESQISTISLKQINGQIKKCPEPSYVDDVEISSLLITLTNNKTDEEKILSLQDFISKINGKPISASNSIKIIQNLKMNTRLSYALGLLKDYFYIASKDLETIIKNEKSNLSRVLVFENLSTSLLDKDKVILEGILDSLECEEKAKIKLILEKTKPKDCFFGDLNISKVVFVFDLSGSMDSTFNFQGKIYTRLQFLKDNFVEAFQNLDENQYYQIVVFSETARFLHGGSGKLIQATEDNLIKTIDAVDRLEAGGYTNISDGLRLPLQINDNINEIFLFSDGAPTVGLQTVDLFKKFIAEQYQLRKTKNLNRPKINVNLLMLGGQEYDKERKLANSFSSTIASLTGGVVKYYGK